MKLWIVRHARPLIAAGICYGAIDVAADAEHNLQAAHALAQALPLQCKVWVSPLLRCQQLAQSLSERRPELQAHTEIGLREMDFGAWEGVAWDAIPPQALQAWTDDFGGHRFGGVESANAVLARVAQVWDQAQQVASAEVVWITHAGVARAAQLLSLGIRSVDSASQWPQDAPGYGQWWCIG